MPNAHSKDQVIIYTDGGCRGNPGIGAFGAVLTWQSPSLKRHKKELSQGFDKTTNNRMELLAVIEALEILKRPCDVQLYSDSKYVVNGIEKNWAKAWQKRGWRKADKQPAVNIDLWKRLLAVLENHRVTLHWVKGHSGNAGNERCDTLCNDMMDQAKHSRFQADEYYLKPMQADE